LHELSDDIRIVYIGEITHNTELITGNLAGAKKSRDTPYYLHFYIDRHYFYL